MMRAVRGGRGPLVQFRSAGGAVNDIPAGATAFAHRTGQVFVVGHPFPPGTESDLAEIWAPIWPHATGTYVNGESGTGSEVFHRAYPGTTVTRAGEVWQRYDPDGSSAPCRPDREQ